MDFMVGAVGVVREGLARPAPGRMGRCDVPRIDGRIEIFPEYAEALDGLEAFSHIFVVSYLHARPEGAPRLLKVVPRPLRGRAAAGKGSAVGVFATHSPARPTPIGLTLVRLLRRDGNTLTVRALDLYEGTPVLDIKPYGREYLEAEYEGPEWVNGDDAMPRSP